MSRRVTVVMAARDAAATVRDAVASVQQQTYDDWELVVVDDGSTDGTGDLARAAGERVRVLRNDVATGPGAARNRGARESTGELLATLDADDVWKPEYLESQVAAYERATASGRRVGVVCCDAELADASGPTGRFWTDRVGRTEQIGVEAMLEENVVFTSVLMARSAFVDVGGYEEDPRLGVEDYDLWLRLLEARWEIVMNPAALAVYRLAPGTRSGSVVRMAEGSALTLERALARGALSPAQARQARKRRRMYETLRRRALIVDEPRSLRRAVATARAAPHVLVSALEHPERWRLWLRRGPRSAGAGRHES